MGVVYLAGTITTDKRHIEWRDKIVAELAQCDIDAISPIRDKDPSQWTKDGYEVDENLPYANGGYVARDLYDIRRSDIIILNALHMPDRQSIGTWFEFGYAVAIEVPVIVVANDDIITKHPFVYKNAVKTVNTIDKAVEFVKFFLNN